MPELPEVENARLRLLPLVGHPVEVRIADDPIVAPGLSGSLNLGIIESIGRQGKVLWIQGDKATLGLHLGMSGAIDAVGETGLRYGHGTNGDSRMRYAKAWFGERFVMTDPRRLGRIWRMIGPIEEDRALRQLGPDAWLALPSLEQFERLWNRKPAIKTLLLNQSIISGIGNYLADEILIEAGIAPHRPGNTLKSEQLIRLRSAILLVLDAALAVNAESDRFPANWLFHVRWHSREPLILHGDRILVKDLIGGRATWWCPAEQS